MGGIKGWMVVATAGVVCILGAMLGATVIGGSEHATNENRLQSAELQGSDAHLCGSDSIKDSASRRRESLLLEQGWRKIRARISFYCATGRGCHCRICGGHLETAWGRDARESGGVAVDPRDIPFGSRVLICGREYIADDSGVSMRKAWCRKGQVWVDVRVAGKKHREVKAMGVKWAEIWVKE